MQRDIRFDEWTRVVGRRLKEIRKKRRETWARKRQTLLLFNRVHKVMKHTSKDGDVTFMTENYDYRGDMTEAIRRYVEERESRG